MSDRRTMSVDDVATELGVNTRNVYRMLRTNGRAMGAIAGVTPATIGSVLGHADARMAERAYARASPLELAGVQRAELRLGSGMHMGSDPGETGSIGLNQPPTNKEKP